MLRPSTSCEAEFESVASDPWLLDQFHRRIAKVGAFETAYQAVCASEPYLLCVLTKAPLFLQLFFNTSSTVPVFSNVGENTAANT